MLGKRLHYEVEDQKICFQFEKGQAIIEVLRDDIVNIWIPYEKNEHRSKAIEGEKKLPVNVCVDEQEDAVIIKTAALILKIYDEFYLDIYDAKGQLLCADYRGNRAFSEVLTWEQVQLLMAEGHDTSGIQKKDYAVQVLKCLEGDEKFYGLGDKSGFLNKKDYEYENWNSDIPQAHNEDYKALYKSIPFLITRKEKGVFGLFFDNTAKSYINLGKESEKYYLYGADSGNLDYYFIAGANMQEVVKGYTYLTGTTPLPQLWTLGYQQSRWGYSSAEDMRSIAKNMREHAIPCDAIHFDIDYMDGYRVFTWNEKDYGKPGEIVEELGEQGFKVVAIVDPGVKLDEGYTVYDEGIEQSYFATTPEGEVYVNAVWPGDAVYPDFGKESVRNWWSKKESYLTNLGVRGVWNDMNEPASFNGELPEDVMFTDEDEPLPHAKMHNIYGHLMSKATYEGLKAADGRRPFVITRACYAGTQKYSTVWTGDNQSLWAHLQMAVPQLCNLGMSGFSFAGTDVGGFGADCTPELLCRWVQVGAFSPLFRNHSANGCRRQEPWQFDEKTLEINRKYISLRYRLLPYFYDLCYQCEKTGLPVMRPLVLHYENDPETWNLNGEFLVGENLLVAPVLEQGATKKSVYLPQGIWYDFDTCKKYVGGTYYLVDAPLDTCPLFVKEGSIIPTFELMQYVGEKPYDTLKLLLYPGMGTYMHYQDNGEDFAYRNGAYNLYEFSQNSDGTMLKKMLHEGYPQYAKIEYIRKEEQ